MSPDLQETKFLYSRLDKLTPFSFHEIIPDEATAIRICGILGLVPEKGRTPPPNCPNCSEIMSEKNHPANRLGFVYICWRKKLSEKQPPQNQSCSRRSVARCGGYMSPLKGTFFSSIRTTFLQILRIVYCWISKLPVTTASQFVQVARQTAVDFYSFCREVAEIVISNTEVKIGGPGLHVEVDEKYTRKRKYHRGRIIKTHQVVIFGAVCRETKQGMFWQVNNKNRRVLWRNMLEYIEPGSIIISDAVPQYKDREYFGLAGHKFFNHKKKDPGRFVNIHDASNHTQDIEMQKKYLKETMKLLRTDRALQERMCEYTYRSRVLSSCSTYGQKFRRFLEDVARVYRGPGQETMQLKTIGISVDEDVGAAPYFDVDIDNAEEAENGELEQVESSNMTEDTPPTSRQKKEKSIPRLKRKKVTPRPKMKKKYRKGAEVK